MIDPHIHCPACGREILIPIDGTQPLHSCDGTQPRYNPKVLPASTNPSSIIVSYTRI